MIGHEVEVTVIDIRGDKVRLGINAPRAVSVHRKEVYEAIKRENEAAAQMQVQPAQPAQPAQPGSGVEVPTEASSSKVDTSVDRSADKPRDKSSDDSVRSSVRLVDPTPSARRSRRPRGESKA